jgi:hypothetical protein
VAAGAAEIAALDKHGVAETRSVHDGLRLYAAYEEGIRPGDAGLWGFARRPRGG